MKPCRECQHEISEQARACPHCGAPHPARPQADGVGFEYRSEAMLGPLPLLHVSFGFRNGVPRPARGVVAIGQFAVGFITISQFGIGVISISQFTIAGLALAQIAFAYALVAQIGLYVGAGYGQVVRSVSEVLAMMGNG